MTKVARDEKRNLRIASSGHAAGTGCRSGLLLKVDNTFQAGIMATKQTSFLRVFLATAFGTTVLGLIVMYFGYYRTRILSYETYIADMQNKPTPDADWSVRSPENEDGASSTSPDAAESDAAESQKPAVDGTASTGSGITVTEEKTEGTENPVQLDRKAPADQKPAENAPSASPKQRNRPPRRSSVPSGGEMEPAERGPAFPKTQPSDTGQTEPESPQPEEEKQDIPDINDPELDDNPLIRALREASQRQSENPDRQNEDNPPQNPFEAILNTQDN